MILLLEAASQREQAIRNKETSGNGRWAGEGKLWADVWLGLHFMDPEKLTVFMQNGPDLPSEVVADVSLPISHCLALFHRFFVFHSMSLYFFHVLKCLFALNIQEL